MSSRSNSLAPLNRPHLQLPSPRSSSLGGANRAPLNQDPLKNSSLGRESGFQSTTSLKSSLVSLNNFETSEDILSMMKAKSGSGRFGGSGRFARTSASMVSSTRTDLRQALADKRGKFGSFYVIIFTYYTFSNLTDEFAEFCQTRWPLKPLFFEVPQRDPEPLFVGRQWLFSEIQEHLSSDLPTNRGVLVSGASGTGKTAIILKLVEQSCFGNGENIYQGKFFNRLDF